MKSNGFWDWILGIKKRKGERPSEYYVIDWGEEAKKYGIGHDYLKKIYHMYGKYIVGIEPYSKQTVNLLRKERMFIKDLTEGQIIPKESIFMPEASISLGRIKLHGLVRE